MFILYKNSVVMLRVGVFRKIFGGVRWMSYVGLFRFMYRLFFMFFFEFLYFGEFYSCFGLFC